MEPLAGEGSSGKLNREQALQQNNSNRNPPGSVSAALGAVRAEARDSFPSSALSSSSQHSSSNLSSSNSPAANLASNVRFPGEDGGRSLAEMAQRDLDAALQLLADRAQYITGASGAAIALRRDGRNDMLCRASTGSNAPELGALLSTEFGLSGASVRTRQALRCDDAERDARVNQEVCRQMGIASVVVMPVVNDDEVLGVFELFSGRANAFGARDVSAVQRLSEMVETAVRLALATQNLPEQLKMKKTSVPEAAEDQILDGRVLEDVVLQPSVAEEQVLEEPEPVVKAAAEKSTQVAEVPIDQRRTVAAPEAVGPTETKTAENREAAVPKSPDAKLATNSEKVREDEAPIVEKGASVTTKKLFWSAEENSTGDVSKTDDADRSHVPPVLRGLHKCEACGFPVSAGRVLCVECEEKKFRGQLNASKAAAGPTTGVPAIAETSAKSKSPPSLAEERREKDGAPSGRAAAAPAGDESKIEEGQGSNAPKQETAEAAQTGEISSPEFVLSAGLEPSQSWLAANKYVVGAVLVVAAAVAVVFLLR